MSRSEEPLVGCSDDPSYDWMTVLGGPETKRWGEGEGGDVNFCVISMSRCIISLDFTVCFLRRTFRCFLSLRGVGIELVDKEGLTAVVKGEMVV